MSHPLFYVEFGRSLSASIASKIALLLIVINYVFIEIYF